MEFETLLYEKRDGVAIITLNRPDRLNAINSAMSRELPQAWRAVMNDPEVVVAVLTGAGEKALCTGFDMHDFASGATEVGDPALRGRLASVQFNAIQCGCWKPVITAVNGMCCGGGLHFVADSDVTIAAENATFFDTHVKVGLVMGLEAVGLARRIPLDWVMRLSLVGGGERIDARKALEIGLVSEVVPAANLLDRAREVADLIKGHSPTALARTKRAIWQSLDRGLEDGLEHAWSIIQDHNQHPDSNEGARAFVEKRAPRWAPLSE